MITLQTSPHVTRLNANDWILTSRVVRVSTEDVYPNEPFLEQIAVTVDLLVDNVLEEFLAASTGSKMPAGYDPVKLLSDEIRVNRVVLRARRGRITSIVE